MSNTITYVPDNFITEFEETKTPRNRSLSGYGSKIPTCLKAKCMDGRTRRIYAICYSNAASYYIIVNKKKTNIPDWAFSIN